MPMSRPRQIIAAIAAAAVAAGGLAVILSLADSPVPAAAARPVPVSSIPDPGADVTAPEIEPEPVIEPEPAPQPDLAFGESTPAVMGDAPVAVTVTRVTSPTPDPDYPPPGGLQQVLAEVRITNQGSIPLDLTGDTSMDGHLFGVVMQYGADAQDALPPSSSGGGKEIDVHRLQPGKTARGTYAFDIPEHESQVLVIVAAFGGGVPGDPVDDELTARPVWAGKVSSS